MIYYSDSKIMALSDEEVDRVGGAFRVYWSHQATDWGEVGAWTLGGAVAGSGGGWFGAGLGALGGGAADYVGQHFHVYA